MTGILEEYGLDVDAAEEFGFEVPDGEYDFVVGDVFVRVGSKNQPDKSWLIIDYLLGETGKKHGELFGLPEDSSAPTDKEKAALGRYKTRLLSLGFEEGTLNEIGREELVGIAGHFTLLTSKGYQNIRNLTIPDDGENQFSGAKEGPGNPARAIVEDEVAPEPVAKKAPVKRATPAAKAAPSEAPATDDNPFS
jgi:hypothetical protein